MKKYEKIITWSHFLLLVVTFFFGFNAVAQTEDILTYIITLFLISVSIVYSQKRSLINSNNFFLAYYIYVMGLGPLFFLSEQLRLNYNYYTYVLGGLLCFAWGTFIGVLLLGGREKKARKAKRKTLRFNIERVKVLRLLWAISVVAGLYYAYKNREFLFQGDVQNGRVAAMAGNGMLIQLAQLSIVALPMIYELYYDGPRKYGRRFSSGIEIIICSAISFAVLLLQGYRSYALTFGLCMMIVIFNKNNVNNRRIVFAGIGGIVVLEFLGLIRASSSISTRGLFNFALSFRNSLVVNNSNFSHILATFPYKTPFQYGKTYFMDFLILRPGPDIDFTLWLKEQVGIAFAGGGRTPSILGEAYINFGTPFIFICMFLLGIVGVATTNYHERHEKDFFGAFLMWQFAHCASGGITNVVLPITLNYIVYRFALMFPSARRIGTHFIKATNKKKIKET